MPEITIPLPDLQPGQHVEVLVRVGQTQHQYSFRVEWLAWADCAPAVSRPACLQRLVRQYPPSYQLRQIGAATDRHVQVMFQHVHPPTEPGSTQGPLDPLVAP